jgi:hypothetical protein
MAVLVRANVPFRAISSVATVRTIARGRLVDQDELFVLPWLRMAGRVGPIGVNG